MAETAEAPEDPRMTEREMAAEATSCPEKAEAMIPPRRFYANLADL